MKNTINTLFSLFAATLLLAGCSSLEIEVEPVTEPQLAIEEAQLVTEPQLAAEPVAVSEPEPVKETQPMILIKTTKGDIKLELDAEKAPNTVANFLKYAESGHYNGTIFHRVISNFMIQGGGFTADMRQKNAPHTVDNEANNGLKNEVGTIAMARTSDPHSAGAQFFINTKDNGFLNFSAPTVQGWGYCVFGKVVEGMDVVKEIDGVATGNTGGHGDVPREPVVITEVQIIE